MIYYIRHLKGIAYFLAFLVLLQSCIIYKKKSSTIEKASSKRNTHIKIITKSGDKYKLKWIEKKEGYVYSIINTRRIKIKKESLNTETPIYIPELINIEDKRDYIMGISMTTKETAIVLIAIDQIDKIKLISHSKTIGIPFATAILSVLLVFIVDYTNPGTSVI